jgi:hypothetical protein
VSGHRQYLPVMSQFETRLAANTAWQNPESAFLAREFSIQFWTADNQPVPPCFAN